MRVVFTCPSSFPRSEPHCFFVECGEEVELEIDHEEWERAPNYGLGRDIHVEIKCDRCGIEHDGQFIVFPRGV